MKPVALVALALLPIALGIPVADDTSATGKPGDNNATDVASTSEWRVTAPTLDCHSRPNGGRIIRRYYQGQLITAICWTTGDPVYGNP